MHKRYLTFFMALGFLLSSCEETDSFYQELAFHYAPVHYQDKDIFSSHVWRGSVLSTMLGLHDK
jgi:hypothetical protein